MPHRLVALAALAVSVAACSSPPSQRRLADEAVAAMGGKAKLQAIQVLAMSGGTGTRLRLGQAKTADGPETPTPELRNVMEIADLANGRASLDYELRNGEFTQHRHEILTKRGEGPTARPVGIEIVGNRPIVATSPGGLFSWGTQNSPEILLRRNVITIALAAAESASEAQPAQDREIDGRMLAYGTAKTRGGEDVGVYFDPQSKLIAAFETIDTEVMLGDVAAQYILRDYRTVDGVSLPHRVTIRKGGKDYSDVQYSSVSINDPKALDVFAIPESAATEAEQAVLAGDYTPLALSKIADGLYLARAYSHNSMVVEFPTSVTVVEAPYTDTQSKVLARLVREQFPNKPIQYAVVTHPHYDHIGGVRGIAAEGATLLVERRHEAVLRPLMDARFLQSPDALERLRDPQKAGVSWKAEFYDGSRVIAEGSQRLELHAVTGSPHVEPMVLAFVPSAGALFQSDLWFPGTGGAGSPEARHLLDSVKALGLRVQVNVGGHGGVGPFSELVTAVGKMQ